MPVMTMRAMSFQFRSTMAKVLKLFGYIANAVTGLLNALLSDNKIISVDIKHIRFRTTFQNIGFYITVLITKRGPWHENIVRKSKSVKLAIE